MKKEIILKSFFFFLIFNSFLFSQIPIEGFCKLDEIKISNNANKIFPYDFNDDGYKDLVVFNSLQKGYYSISANNRASYNSPIYHFTSNTISAIKTQSDVYLGKKVSALINNSKEISLLNFTKNGTINFYNKTKLNGFASSIDIAKNTFGQIELISSGVGIDGIKIFHENKSKINLYENIKGKIFSHLLYFDLNYDSFDDIVAFDVNSNSMVFYYNNHFGDYDEERSIGLKGLISDIQAADINSDRFTDLIINIDGKLNFFLGDSVSSFQKRTNLILKDEEVSSFYIFDFNGDGVNDIAFVNEHKNELKISFGKGNNNFYKPILYLRKNNISQIVGYFDRGGRKLSAISADGFIYIISKVYISDEKYKVSVADSALAVTSFDYRNDGFKDFCWIDSYSKLNVALSERKNLFAQLFQFELQSKNDKMKIDDSKSDIKIFVTYKNKGRSVEIIKYNFNTNELKRKIVYSKFPIEELKIFSDKFKDRFVVNAISKSNNETYFEKMEFVNFNLFKKESIQIASNAVASTLGIYGGTTIASYINQNKNYELVITYLGNYSTKKVSRLTFQLSDKDIVKFSIIKVEQLFSRATPFVSLISINKKAILYLFTEKRNYRYNLNFVASEINDLQYILNESTLEIYFIADNNKLVKLVFDENFNLISTTIMKQQNETKNFVITKFNNQNKYLIFNVGNTLTFNKL